MCPFSPATISGLSYIFRRLSNVWLTSRFPGLLVSVDVWLSNMAGKPFLEQGSRQTLAIYTGLVCGSLFLAMLRALLFYMASLSSSARLHDRMAVSLLKAPVLFFDTNPLGRILNRFSKDIGSLDEVLPTFFISSIQMSLFVVTATLLPAVVNPWLLFAIVPVVVAFFSIVQYYLKSSRELKRLESICRSPVFSHVAETLNGLDTIRVRRREKDFFQQFCRWVILSTQHNRHLHF